MLFTRLALVFVLSLSLLACESKDVPKTQGGIAVSTADAYVAPGLYRTEKVVQPSFRDYNAKETVYSEVLLEGSKVMYIAYRDGKESNRREGTYEPKAHAFLFVNQGSGEYDRSVVAEVKPESFRMKHGRLVLEFKRVP